mmetsp:Transcript_114955/g.324885  ORF Transcript_114955/g.324885 Transcript_114955/m.324885 type:complete len:204 (+) Transcript_114955:411-1022(+)
MGLREAGKEVAPRRCRGLAALSRGRTRRLGADGVAASARWANGSRCKLRERVQRLEFQALALPPSSNDASGRRARPANPWLEPSRSETRARRVGNCLLLGVIARAQLGPGQHMEGFLHLHVLLPRRPLLCQRVERLAHPRRRRVATDAESLVVRRHVDAPLLVARPSSQRGGSNGRRSGESRQGATLQCGALPRGNTRLRRAA